MLTRPTRRTIAFAVFAALALLAAGCAAGDVEAKAKLKPRLRAWAEEDERQAPPSDPPPPPPAAPTNG